MQICLSSFIKTRRKKKRCYCILGIITYRRFMILILCSKFQISSSISILSKFWLFKWPYILVCPLYAPVSGIFRPLNYCWNDSKKYTYFRLLQTFEILSLFFIYLVLSCIFNSMNWDFGQIYQCIDDWQSVYNFSIHKRTVQRTRHIVSLWTKLLVDWKNVICIG